MCFSAECTSIGLLTKDGVKNVAIDIGPIRPPLQDRLRGARVICLGPEGGT